MPLTIEIADDEQPHAVDRARLKRAVRSVLAAAGIESAEISVAIVTDARMHALNRQHLKHDYPTDVLSFVLDRSADGRSLDGEIIASSDYAAREAPRYGWTTDDELLLYVVHGCLHLVGHDDAIPEGRRAMRAAEAAHLAKFGLTHRYEPDAES
jgi:probable rRNA maturation factor